MRRHWPLLLALSACGNGSVESSAQLLQCQQIAEHYSKVARYTQRETRREAGLLHVELRFAVPSALGEQKGVAVCSYRSEQVVRIQLGNTVYEKPSDIADLVALRSSWPLPEHEH